MGVFAITNSDKAYHKTTLPGQLLQIGSKQESYTKKSRCYGSDKFLKGKQWSLPSTNHCALHDPVVVTLHSPNHQADLKSIKFGCCKGY